LDQQRGIAYNVPRVGDAAAGGVPSRLMRRGRAPQRSEERKRLHAVGRYC